MTDKLAKTKVNTLAKPESNILLTARNLIRNHKELQEIFERAKKDDSSTNGLADALYVIFQEYLENSEGLWDVCLYLAEEYFQLGENILIVSAETGESIATLSEEHIYQPPQVLRESGELAKPLPRLKPEIEAALVKERFNNQKEQNVFSTLATRARSSELLSAIGDPRLMLATFKGRKQLTQRLKEELPEIFERTTGTVKLLLDRCVLCPQNEVPEGDYEHKTFNLTAMVNTPVVDLLTTNLYHDAYGSLKTRTSGQWLRGLARYISESFHLEEVRQASVGDTLPEGLWIVGPQIANFVNGKILVVNELTTPILVHDSPVAYICLHEDSYKCQSREFLGKWEVGSEVTGDLYVCKGAVTPYNFLDPEEEFVAEVVKRG